MRGTLTRRCAPPSPAHAGEGSWLAAWAPVRRRRAQPRVDHRLAGAERDELQPAHPIDFGQGDSLIDVALLRPRILLGEADAERLAARAEAEEGGLHQGAV